MTVPSFNLQCITVLQRVFFFKYSVLSHVYEEVVVDWDFASTSLINQTANDGMRPQEMNLLNDLYFHVNFSSIS